MNLIDMLGALSPKKEALTIGNFTFYARPMSVHEFNEHIINPDKDGRDELTILRCIVDESGKPIFENIEQVKSLYTNVKAELVGLVAQASLMPEPAKVEEEVK
ncbi:cytochrome [Salmonella enterica]|nr:cytochrome [Salmonella enterica]EDZ7377403.1 cytochrome [Salmonella enterica]EEK5737692.1 cytochrome [Salmonella enterica]EEL9952933.1 cytochrome [Salmonella enterica]EEM1605871.1 cytochrome [Salmonella enterica]